MSSIAITATNKEEFEVVEEKLKLFRGDFLSNFSNAYKESLSGELVLVCNKRLESCLVLPPDFSITYFTSKIQEDVSKKSNGELNEKVRTVYSITGVFKGSTTRYRIIYTDVVMDGLAIQVQ